MRVETNVKESSDTVDTLNKFLRGEISAVETYNQAIERLSKSAFVADLVECRRSHEERAELLRQQIVRLGDKPAESSGVWGGFAKLVEGGAKLFGEKAALATLEEGEDHGLKLYRSELSKLDPVTRDFVERSLLSAQERTHQVLSTLKHNFH
jgi:hypothetical protein